MSKSICDNVEVKMVKKEESKEKKKVQYIKKKEKKKKKAKKEFIKKTKDLSKKAKTWITKKIKKEKKHFKTIAQLPKSDFISQLQTIMEIHSLAMLCRTKTRKQLKWETESSKKFLMDKPSKMTEKHNVAFVQK